MIGINPNADTYENIYRGAIFSRLEASAMDVGRTHIFECNDVSKLVEVIEVVRIVALMLTKPSNFRLLAHHRPTCLPSGRPYTMHDSASLGELDAT